MIFRTEHPKPLFRRESWMNLNGEWQFETDNELSLIHIFRGGSAGDLLISGAVKAHPVFERDGYDIYCEVPITFTEATLGAEIDIPTLEGKEKFTVPEGTQTGTSFTLKQKGVPYVNNSSRRGDLIITVVIEVPKNLSSAQKEKLREFAELSGETNYTKKTKFFKKFFK